MLDDEPLSSGPQTMRQSRRFSTALARTSAFPRTETHLLQQTVAGAALSVAGAALVLILLVCELRDFMRLSTELKARRQATQGGFAEIGTDIASTLCSSEWTLRAVRRRCPWCLTSPSRGCPVQAS